MHTTRVSILQKTSLVAGPAAAQLAQGKCNASINNLWCLRQHPSAALCHNLHHKPAAPKQPRCVCTRVFPFDQAWSPNAAAASIAPQLFAASLFPYLAFLWFLHKSGKAPRVTLIGFYFLLAFVVATIPAGIYAKVHYGTSLANVDWLHGAAESLLMITNLLIVLGLRQGIREEEAKQKQLSAQEQPSTPGSAASQQSKQ